MNTATKKHKNPMTLHGLLVTLSFWGTSVRALLFAFLAASIFAFALIEPGYGRGLDTEAMILIYVLASFVALDFGYVTVARTYTLRPSYDIMALLVADVLLGLLYILPNVLINSGQELKSDPLMYVIFVPIVVLAVRSLLGMLFGKRSR